MTRLVDRPSENFDKRNSAIDLVVLHYTGMQDAEIALARLTDTAPRAGRYPGPWQAEDIDPDAPLGRVSAHYVVDEAGVVFRLVEEAQRAWHAGASTWEGRSDTNDRSIGIEVVNGGHDFGLPDFTAAQTKAVAALLKDILERQGLAPARVVGHSDVAPARKLDPGEKFPWHLLAAAGVALAPSAEIHASAGRTLSLGDEGPEVAALQRALSTIGYGIADAKGVFADQTAACVAAFQRRFRQADVSGAVDAETRALIDDISAQCAASRA